MRSEGPAYHAEPSELLAETKGSHVHASVAPATHSGTWKKGRGKMSDLENPVPYQHTLCVKAVVSLQRSTMPHAKSDGLLLQRSVYSHATISFNSFTLYAVPMAPGCWNMVIFYVSCPNMSMCKSPNAGHTHFVFFFLINVRFNKNDSIRKQSNIKSNHRAEKSVPCQHARCMKAVVSLQRSGCSKHTRMETKLFLYHL